MNISTIEQKARDLANDIKLSDAFIEFKEIQEKVKKTEAHYEEINEIRRAYFEALNQETQNGVKGAVSAMQQKYALSLAKGYVKEFLEKEQRYCMLVQQVYDILDEAINFDIASIFEDKKVND